jgi:antirestriction protein
MNKNQDQNSQTTTQSGLPSQTEQASTDTNPRIYVACLAAYNNGRLHGRWIDAAQDAKAIRAEISQMLESSPEPLAEEWAIHDYEGFGGFRLSESEDIEEVAAMAAQIVEHGEPYLAALALSSNRAEADALMEEYCGQFNSDEAFAEQLLEDGDMLPKDLPAWIHIDWAWTAKEIMMDYAECSGHYFRQS